jgi:hypothetical protein
MKDEKNGESEEGKKRKCTASMWLSLSFPFIPHPSSFILNFQDCAFGFRCLSNHPSTVLYHSSLFCGFNIQCPSSG